MTSSPKSCLKLILRLRSSIPHGFDINTLTIEDAFILNLLYWIITSFQPTENYAGAAQTTIDSHEVPTEDENPSKDQPAANEDLTNTIPLSLPTVQINDENEIKQSSSAEAQASVLKSSEEDFINILLLGESGVGKSTFINAFVNYLTFPTFKDAESDKPIALIPVSFVITTGHDFTEQIVKLDVPGRCDNEDFEHPGQSVTQQCRSYEFQLKHHNGKKLRIIDTPGFGDTRGLQQDDLNMQHILEYINQFPHLNAVCFLLKPNESRLNISFRTCLMQLLDVLGTDICQNIVFCFTNSRSTFYTPGNTSAILKTMIKSISSTAVIPFQKKNAFCFDSESFRYLIALKQGISFDDAERSEYETSWIKSVKEFNRLLHHIEQSIVVNRLNENGQSIKHAQFQINQLIEPMLHSIQYALQNMIAQHQTSNVDTIKISHRVSLLTYASAMFARFLVYHTAASKTDPFLTGLRKMDKNEQLSEKLQSTISNYETQWKKAQREQKYLELPVIYSLIKIIPQNCETAIQRELIENSQEKMTIVDYEVPIDSINGSI